MKLQYIHSCPYCNSTSCESIITRPPGTFDKHANSLGISLPEVEYLKCSSCSLSFRTPIHHPDYIKSLYKESYRSTVDPQQLFESVMAIPSSESELDLKVDFLIDKCSITNKSHVCDIGSGCGAFLYKLANKTSSTPFGIEPDIRFSTFTSEVLSINTLSDYYSGQSLKSFDVVTILHVLEHVTDSWSLFPLFFGSMKSGAYLYIETPSDLDAIYLPSEHNRFTLPHIYLFSTSFLSSLSLNCGFTVISNKYVKTQRSKYDCRILLQKP